MALANENTLFRIIVYSQQCPTVQLYVSTTVHRMPKILDIHRALDPGGDLNEETSILQRKEPQAYKHCLTEIVYIRRQRNGSTEEIRTNGWHEIAQSIEDRNSCSTWTQPKI